MNESMLYNTSFKCACMMYTHMHELLFKQVYPYKRLYAVAAQELYKCLLSSTVLAAPLQSM